MTYSIHSILHFVPPRVSSPALAAGSDIVLCIHVGGHGRWWTVTKRDGFQSERHIEKLVLENC
jgi:hypothetical protein